MKIKRILLTGDDGYNSIGTRVLIHHLKNQYEVVVAGTRDQQSGVGGHISVRGGGSWGVEKVDGVPALWVSGYPADAVECAQAYFKKPFDLIISGVNLGLNIGDAVISSGTVAAAYRGMGIALAPRAIVMSMHAADGEWAKKHSVTDDISRYVEYPGTVAEKILHHAISNNFWNAYILNINFPLTKTNKVRFTKPLPNLSDHYPPPVMDKTSHEFHYPYKMVEKKIPAANTDVGAIRRGYISISVYGDSLFDHTAHTKVAGKEFVL